MPTESVPPRRVLAIKFEVVQEGFYVEATEKRTEEDGSAKHTETDTVAHTFGIPSTAIEFINKTVSTHLETVKSDARPDLFPAEATR